MFPTADQIATAIVMACRFTECNPILTALGTEAGEKARGRHLAMAALVEAFPEARHTGLARCCGYLKSPSSARSNLKIIRRGAWWSDEWVDEIVGALVADQYGEDDE